MDAFAALRLRTSVATSSGAAHIAQSENSVRLAVKSIVPPQSVIKKSGSIHPKGCAHFEGSSTAQAHFAAFYLQQE